MQLSIFQRLAGTVPDYVRPWQQRYNVPKLTIPVYLSMLLHMLVGNVDQVMVGQYSPESVAAIGNANQLMNLVFLLFNVVCLATLIFVTNYIGAKEYQKARELYTVSLCSTGVFSVLMGIFLWLAAPAFFRLINTDESIFDLTLQYTRIVSSFIFLQAIAMVFGVIFQGNARMKSMLLIALATNCFNIVGNLLLIPRFGVNGAAVATVVSRAGGVLIAYWIFHTQMHERFRWECVRHFPMALLGKLLKVGVPVAGEMFSYSLSQTAILAYINLMGTLFVTMRAYSNMLAFFSAIFTFSLAQTSQVIVGYMLGAHEPESAHWRTMRTLKIGIAVSCSLMFVLFCCSSWIFTALKMPPEMVRLGRWILFCELFLEIGRATNVIMTRSLQTAGDIRYPTILCILSTWFFSVFGGYLLGVTFQWGLLGVWIAMTIDENFRGVLFIRRWKSGKWRKKLLV